MHSTYSARPWQLAPVSRFGRLAVAMLLALALDSAVTWSSFANPWTAAILVVAPLLIAIRVARGFDQALATAISMFIAGGVIALGRFTSLGAAAAATIALTVVGIVAACLEIRHHRRQSTIRLSRSGRDGPEPVVVRH